MKPNPRRRALPSCSKRWCAALLGAAALCSVDAVAEAAPPRPTLARLPIVSLPRQEALAVPTVVDTSSENLPFELILPADRPKETKQKKSSNSYEYQHWLSLRALRHDVCLRANGANAARSEDRDQLEFYNYSGYAEQIGSVRAERLEFSSADPQRGAELVVEDYFVSPRAAKARHASTTRVPLVQVAEMDDGLTVYAFREPQRLTLVLSAPSATMIMPNASAVSLGCGVARVSLDTSTRSGVATSFALAVPDRVEPESVENFRAWNQVPMQHAWRVSVSVSQTSRDPAPVLSLTFGDPSRPVRDALRDRMPRWNEVLGQERAAELEQKLAKRN